MEGESKDKIKSDFLGIPSIWYKKILCYNCTVLMRDVGLPHAWDFQAHAGLPWVGWKFENSEIAKKLEGNWTSNSKVKQFLKIGQMLLEIVRLFFHKLVQT